MQDYRESWWEAERSETSQEIEEALKGHNQWLPTHQTRGYPLPEGFETDEFEAGYVSPQAYQLILVENWFENHILAHSVDWPGTSSSTWYIQSVWRFFPLFWAFFSWIPLWLKI